MKDIRIFIASSKELEQERNYLAFLVLSKEEEFAACGLRIRLAKWEYVDPRMTTERTEDLYLEEMYNCDAALVMFKCIVGKFTKEELDKAIVAERDEFSRLKTHRILFSDACAADSEAAKLRSSLRSHSYGVFSGEDELQKEFLSLVDRIAQYDRLVEAPSDKYVRKVTAFIASDDELVDERNAFADTVLNVNDLLELGHRNLRIRLKFYDADHDREIIESSEMGLVLYGTNYHIFKPKDLDAVRTRGAGQNPKLFYVFFRNLDAAVEKTLDEAFRLFRSNFATKYGHFPCQFGDVNALRLAFLLSLERYASEFIEQREIFSTVTVPTASAFVGREAELRKLCGLLESIPGVFPAGRLPVITGAGGVGKSELVRQYASQLRIQYPGGLFQVDMEHVETWDDTFLGILKGVSNNGVKVADYLELNLNDNADKGVDASIVAKKVREALLKKAGTAGPMLIVLDNVENCMSLLEPDGGFNQAFPAGFSERVRVNIIATARVCDVRFKPTDWAIPFPLGDLSPRSALELLLKDKCAEGENELAAAKRIAELLGYRALHLRRVPAIIGGGNKKSRIVCRSYRALAENLEKDSLLTINRTAMVEEKYLPERLWGLIQNSLSEWRLGEACIKLIKIASFFSPDGFARHVLRHLWEKLVFSGLEDCGSRDEVFEQVFDLTKHYNVFQSADPIRIHRLDRTVILQAAKHELGLEEAVGKTLASYGAMSQEDWLTLADNPSILRQIPHDKLMPEKQPLTFHSSLSLRRNQYRLGLRLILKNPDYKDSYILGALDGDEWSTLLRSRPQLADCCPWEKLDGYDWARTLQKQPQFANWCAWEKIEGGGWATLLSSQPQFACRCPWEKIGASAWVDLLIERPQFACYCSWDKLDGDDWVRLIQSQPRFSDHCQWEKLDVISWVRLLTSQPQFVNRCPLKMFNGEDWSHLLQKQPSYLSGYCRWHLLDRRDWKSLLQKQPQFADRCPWRKFLAQDWAELIGAQPQFANRCPWKMLGGSNWSYLLQMCPQFADKCDWTKLDGDNWKYLLSVQPQFAIHCSWPKVTALGGWAWRYLLERQPQFSELCPWEKLDGDDWARVLCSQPQLSKYCAWEKLKDKDWRRLLKEQPQFANCCPCETLSQTEGGEESW